MSHKSQSALKFDLAETESAITNGRGNEQFRGISKQIKGDLIIIDGSGETIFNQLRIAFELNEPVASYLMGKFRKDKACSSDLQYSVTLYVRSSTNPRTINFLKILSSELGPEGQHWCTDCVTSILSNINHSE